ncbi:MAG: hypothetical protein ACRCS9_06225, partial [Hyphomicrobium sp.]
MFRYARIAVSLKVALVVACALAGGARNLMAADTPAAKPGPAYSVVSVDGAAGQQRISIRIPKRLDDAHLQALADTVAARQKAGAQSVQAVLMYLPTMGLSEKPWAVVTLQAPTSIAVFGLTAADVEGFRAHALADRRDLIGVWLTSPPALTGRLTILRDKRRVFAEWQLRSGEKTVDEVLPSRGGNGRRFEIVGSAGGYYMIARDGSLQLGENANVIAVAEALDIGPAPAKTPAVAAVPPPSAGKGHANAASGASTQVAVPAATAVAATAGAVGAMPSGSTAASTAKPSNAGDATAAAATAAVALDANGKPVATVVPRKSTARSNARSARAKAAR